MRFSDLNKAKAEQPKPEPVKKAPPAAAEPRPEPVPPPAQPPETAAVEPVSRPEPGPAAPEKPLSPRNRQTAARQAQRKEPSKKNQLPPLRELDAEAREIYAKLMTMSGELLRASDQPYTEKYEAAARTCGAVVETLRNNPALLYYASYSTADDYLKAHSANVALISLAMGVAAGLDAAELKLLGFCALAHDIGMTAYSGLYGREARLSEEEFSRLMMHAADGADKLDRIVDLDYKVKDRAKRILVQIHERLDGSGYPDRVSGEDIDPLAQMIGIADVYEAMTHPRSWREAMEPPDVLKELIEREGRGFNSTAVKSLISALTIYPPGSVVRLSTGEVARVRCANKGSLTRPLVEVLLDENFEPVQPRVTDLLEYPLTAIEGPVPGAELAERAPSFSGKLELERWWVEW